MIEILNVLHENPLVTIVLFSIAVGFIFLWGVLAGARVDESCMPEHRCETCRHNRTPMPPQCCDCLRSAPYAPNWEAKA